jgi:DNA-binding beta-propeller fold protein YncE
LGVEVLANNIPFKIKKGIAAPYYPVTATALSGTAIDVSSAQYYTTLLSADTTYTFTNAPSAGEVASFALEITGPATAAGYDIANATYDNVSFSVAAYDTAPLGVSFKPDGTEMYIAGNQGDTIDQYSLSTGFDLSTASYTQSTSIAAVATVPAEVLFNDTGTKMYVLNQGDDTIYEYSLSTAWDITTKSATAQTGFVGTQAADPVSMTFNDNGTKLYVVDRNNDKLYQYSLSTAYDITTLSYDSILLDIATGGEDIPWGVTFNGDGSAVYVVGQTNDTIYKYNCSSPYNIGGASYNSESFSVSSQEGSPTSIKFNSTGSKMYVVGYANDTVYQYTTQGSSSAYTITWPTNIKWDGGSAPTSPDVGAKDLYIFFTLDGGVTYFGKKAGEGIS